MRKSVVGAAVAALVTFGSVPAQAATNDQGSDWYTDVLGYVQAQLNYSVSVYNYLAAKFGASDPDLAGIRSALTALNAAAAKLGSDPIPTTPPVSSR